MGFFERLFNFGEEVSNSAPLSDRLMMGLQTTLLGMGVIFVVLIILWAVLSVFKLVFYKGKAEKKSVEPAPAPAVVERAPTAPTPTAQNDEEIVAAITAAIAVMLDVPQTSFRVVSFRRSAKK